MKKTRDKELERRTGHVEAWNRDGQGLVQGKAKQLEEKKQILKSLRKWKRNGKSLND